MKAQIDIKFAQFFFELISLSPLLILLGNLLPPVGLKLHYYLFGILFLMSIVWIASRSDKKWILYVALVYLAVQFTLSEWNVKGFIDFFFGPFTIITMMDILFEKYLSNENLKRYTYRFLFTCSIPIAIAALQFMDLIPIKFLNAQYVNFTHAGDGIRRARPNGFLYHGSELSIIIFYMAAIQIFKPAKKAIPMFILLLFCAYTTMFKSILMTTGLLFIYFIFFIDREVFYKFQVWKKKRLFSYVGLAVLLGLVVVGIYFSIVYKYTGLLFHQQFLTGRGAIWNIYLEGVKDFTILNYLFGYGMGGEHTIFESYASPRLFYPLTVDPILRVSYGTHNSILGVFINSGIIGIATLISVFYIIIKNLKQVIPDDLFKKRIVAILLLPVFTFGITIPLFEMAIFWPLVGFSFCFWYIQNQQKNA